MQIPGYLEKEDALKAAGIDEVMLFAVNDAAVMKAWEKDQECEDSIITFYGDPDRELTEALDVVLDHPGPMAKFGEPRCKRVTAFVDDGIIKTFHVAEGIDDPAGDDHPEEACVDNVLTHIEKVLGLMPHAGL